MVWHAGEPPVTQVDLAKTLYRVDGNRTPFLDGHSASVRTARCASDDRRHRTVSGAAGLLERDAKQGHASEGDIKAGKMGRLPDSLHYCRIALDPPRTARCWRSTRRRNPKLIPGSTIPFRSILTQNPFSLDEPPRPACLFPDGSPFWQFIACTETIILIEIKSSGSGDGRSLEPHYEREPIS